MDATEGQYRDIPSDIEYRTRRSEFEHFQYIDRLMYKTEARTYQLCVPDVFVGSRRVWEILLQQAHSILAHLGSKKTLEYLCSEVWWQPEMVSDVTHCIL
ncbi:hypothetical protein L226DRAFT_469740 [Lentinus tigrinus ALCF2SS1-7]|uniref:Integrase zinc-binding domain-containing protein n=1 Tax=Lentinus tigrinus ALCF2SS1-6 TaxID=1328759 RepID=A0A5C2RWF7_9APHY|nr:hypothetical protein L227DRAFT_510055 [Lentinus tigrinus ALCF2SS1-6]RPD70629.1 hypothetical protein L226DRAFT_469740 [Lentinus tigrinus ALCF2SS1-7]